MAKKKSEKKSEEIKKEEKKTPLKIEIPNTKMVKITLNKDGKNYEVGNSLAHTLINAKKAKLA